MTAIARDAHASGTKGKDQSRFSRTTSGGPCVIVDTSHLLAAVTLAQVGRQGIREGTDRRSLTDEQLATALAALDDALAEQAQSSPSQ